MKLNLGSSDRHIDGYLCVDLDPPPCAVCGPALQTEGFPPRIKVVRSVNLDMCWPWEDSSVNEILAYDIVEHLHSRIHTMNEAHRVLRPGGVLSIVTPNAAKGGGYFQDPTHITPWTIHSFAYFDVRRIEYQRFALSYGITAKFRVQTLYEETYQDTAIAPGCARPDPVYKIHVKMEAVKP